MNNMKMQSATSFHFTTVTTKSLQTNFQPQQESSHFSPLCSFVEELGLFIKGAATC